jgi:hypothetical protein
MRSDMGRESFFVSLAKLGKDIIKNNAEWSNILFTQLANEIQRDSIYHLRLFYEFSSFIIIYNR